MALCSWQSICDHWNINPGTRKAGIIVLRHLFYKSVALIACTTGASALADIPHLVQQGTAVQLMVKSRPMLILGGELGNSSASSPQYMSEHWARLKRMHLNTVLAPIYWELIEPVEGRYDWSSVDALIK